MESDWAAVWVAIGAALVAGASAVFSAISLGYTRGQRDASERQANAAEAQTAYMARQVELMEQDAEEARAARVGSPTPTASSSAPVSARARVVPWSLVHSRGDTYSLINGGTEPVYDVSIEAPAKTVFRAPEKWDRVDPRATVNFLLAFSMASSGRDVTVRWRWEPEGDVETWTSAVPMKGSGGVIW